MERPVAAARSLTPAARGVGRCLAELIENSFDDFNEITIFIILEAAGRRCRFQLRINIASAPELNAFAIAVTAYPFWSCCCQPDYSTAL
jgi:hypothetical protein